MGAVPEFGRALTTDLGAPKGRIATYTEVQLKDGDGRVSIPDGVIVAEYGKKRWSALVEVKTGGATLQAEQVARYVEMARQHGFDAVLTISNQITAKPADSPISLHKGKLKRVALYHLSWWRILTEAVLQHRFRGVDDPDQAWILGELIAYLDHENSGASGFQDMGRSWVSVRDGARQGTLRPSDKEVRTVAERWEQFIDYLALGLSQDLGRDVEAIRPRRQSLADRVDSLVRGVASDGTLIGAVRVPDAIAPLVITADLRARQLTTSVTADAPKEGRPKARINWMLRQLAGVSPHARVTVSFANTRETTSALLDEAREYPDRLLSPTDRTREPRSFEVALTTALGTKAGRGPGSFVRETRRQLIDFYGEVVQNLKPWQAKAPKLPDAREPTPDTPQSTPPPFTALDDREFGEATTPGEPARPPAQPQPTLTPSLSEAEASSHGS
jgi:hypothetical protein